MNIRPEIYLEEWLPPFQEDISTDTLKRRNKALTWQFVQICSSFTGFFCYILTKLRLYLFVNTFTLFLALIGLYGTLKLEKCPITIHGFVFFLILMRC